MRSRADAGDSNAEIARQMGIDLTSVAHHLALLTLAARARRSASKRPLHVTAHPLRARQAAEDRPRASQGDRRRRRRDHPQCGRVIEEGPLGHLARFSHPSTHDHTPSSVRFSCRSSERPVRSPRRRCSAAWASRTPRSPRTNWQPFVVDWRSSARVRSSRRTSRSSMAGRCSRVLHRRPARPACRLGRAGGP